MRKQKIINELEAHLEKQGKIIKDLDNKIFGLERQLHNYEETFDRIGKLQDSMPADCKSGTYCEACEFSEPIRINNNFSIRTMHICKKGTICSNFCQKEHE